MQAPLKVDVIVPSMELGGVTRAWFLAQALDRAGCRVRVTGQLREGAAIYPAPPAGLCVEPVVDDDHRRAARELRRRLDGDIVYAVKPRPMSFGVAILATCGQGRGLLVDIDDWEVALSRRRAPEGPALLAAARGGYRRLRRLGRMLRNPNARVYAHWMERLLGRADAITTSSHFLEARFGGTYLPSGKDTERWDPGRHDGRTVRERFGLGRRRVLMFPGTVRSHKGLEDLLDVLDAMGRDDVCLVLVGGRDTGAAAAAALAARWPHRVVRLPRFGADEMPGVVAAADVVVVPQRDTVVARAQFPIKLTDAMAMATPIVTTAVGDIPEVVGDAGWVVPPGDAGALRRALEEALDDPEEARRRGRLARARCETRFSVAAAAVQLRSLLHLD